MEPAPWDAARGAALRQRLWAEAGPARRGGRGRDLPAGGRGRAAADDLRRRLAGARLRVRRDVARATLAAAQLAGGVLNVATGRASSVLELVDAMRRATGREIDPEHGPERLGDLQRSVLDPSLAERDLGWRAEVSLEDGLRATWQYFYSFGLVLHRRAGLLHSLALFTDGHVRQDSPLAFGFLEKSAVVTHDGIGHEPVLARSQRPTEGSAAGFLEEHGDRSSPSSRSGGSRRARGRCRRGSTRGTAPGRASADRPRSARSPPWHGRRPSRVRQEERAQPPRELARHLAERSCSAPEPVGHSTVQRVAVEVVVALERLDQQIVDREPHRPAPVRVAAEQPAVDSPGT